MSVERKGGATEKYVFWNGNFKRIKRSNEITFLHNCQYKVSSQEWANRNGWKNPSWFVRCACVLWFLICREKIWTTVFISVYKYGYEKCHDAIYNCIWNGHKPWTYRLWAACNIYFIITKHFDHLVRSKFNILAANMQINSNEMWYYHIHCMSLNILCNFKNVCATIKSN